MPPGHARAAQRIRGGPLRISVEVEVALDGTVALASVPWRDVAAFLATRIDNNAGRPSSEPVY